MDLEHYICVMVKNLVDALIKTWLKVMEHLQK